MEAVKGTSISSMELMAANTLATKIHTTINSSTVTSDVQTRKSPKGQNKR